ncbi:hypothetical protein OS493_010004 [Desmophyllum pertusum]|uniref:Uncharacterized protein n=1 Tax=Desmophyllum pertusum TaxID=174260 RepID=A0A9W9YEP6_9CNID|nr:hypothetical protein OS493_010004 [Desmophyllum pertusum]
MHSLLSSTWQSLLVEHVSFCNNDLYDGGNKESHGVKIMVCCLGAVGFTCWMIKAAIACYWAATVNDRDDIADSSYIRWDATKFAVRCRYNSISDGLFMKVNARAFPLRNATTKMNHLLVPAVICEIKEQTSLKILFEVGPPMYLGFLIHSCVKVFSSQATFILFLIGTMMVSVNIFTNADNLLVKIYFRLAVGFLVGIAFVLAGAVLFFSTPDESATNPPTLGRQQPSMGLVVGAITIPLIIAEIFLLVAAYASKKEQASHTEAHQRLWTFVLADKATFLVQKIVQAGIYILFLRYKTICPRYTENAQFYLKTLAFYNFIEWVDSQVNEDRDVQLSQPDLVYNAWFDVFVAFTRH